MLAAELQALGAQNLTLLKRAVAFEGDLRLLYAANLCCRTALRILQPISEAVCHNERELYDWVYSLDWAEYIQPELTFALDNTVYSDVFRHSQFAMLTVKDAIIDQFRNKFDKRPSISPTNPDIRLQLHISGTNCHLLLDSSGGSLHLRGYRKTQGEAPINEVLAAGMVLLSGWDRQQTFIDPMCGAGTILAEAAMIAQNIAPNLLREQFAFQKWGNYDMRLWQEVREEAITKQVENEVPILGFDIDYDILNKALENLERLGVADAVELTKKNIADNTPPATGGIVVTNPPYGERIQAADADIFDFYRLLGDSFKQRFKGYKIYLITSNLEAAKHIHLKASRRIPLFNGKLECRLLEYVMVEGSNRRGTS